MAELAQGRPVPGARPYGLPRRPSRDRLVVPEAMLIEVLSGLVAAATSSDAVAACLPRLQQLSGVRATAVAQRSGRRVVLLGSAGYDCATMAPGAELPLDAGLPVTEAVRTGRTVVQGTGPSWVAVPFGGGPQHPGALLLSLDWAPPEAAADLSRLHRLAGALGDAVRRAASAQADGARLAAVCDALAGAPRATDGVIVRCTPADGEVGGDVVLSLPDDRGGRWLLAADVVGTGLVAGLITRSVRAAVRAAAPSAAGPADLLQALDRGICDDVPPGCFVTALVVHLDGDGGLTAASAGHPAPVVVLDGRSVELTVQPGPPLALEAATPAVHSETSGTLPAGAVLLLYTDGLVERRTADGVRLLDAATLADGLPSDLELAADRLLAAADAAGPAQDDVSLLLLRTG